MKESKHDAIYRLEICAWAYGWDSDRLRWEINSFIQDLKWNIYFEQKRKEEEDTVFLIKGLSSNIIGGEISLEREAPKNRSYGDKYIKRKYR